VGGVCGLRFLLLLLFSIDVHETTRIKAVSMGVGGFDSLPFIEGFRIYSFSFHLGNHPGVGKSILDCGEWDLIYDGSFQ
jgi:hypothetical protein